jgi:hypothetical protein
LVIWIIYLIFKYNNKRYMAVIDTKFNTASSFWLDKSMFKNKGETSSITKNLKLLAYKRSISNFVKLLTKKDGYKVMFSSGKQSYTNGNVVVISSKLNENNFDVTVGLALHEASHLLLTDFKIFNRFAGLAADELGQRYLTLSSTNINYIKDLFNIVEDRYIDNFVYTTAPGYRGYYNALYNFYFRKKTLTDWLKKPAQRTETYTNYRNQLLNITNTEFDINCLKAMPEIVNLLDIANIDRLTTTDDRMILALRIYSIIDIAVQADLASKPAPVSNPSLPEEDENNESPENNSSENTEIPEENSDEIPKPENTDANLDSMPLPSPDSITNDSEEEDINEKAEVDELLKDIGNFLEGLTSEPADNNTKLNEKIEALEVSDATEHMVTFGGNQIKTLLVKNLNRVAGESKVYPILNIPSITDYKFINPAADRLREKISAGIILGTQLAQRMMIRNENRSLVINRLNNGKIFNRHVALLGADVENIFFKTKTDTYKPSTIHINIDASGSMCGDRFEQAIVTATAIAKACTYLKGVNCVIAFRSEADHYPATYVAYNSKKDHFSKIPDIFPYLKCNSSTPEGLCYSAYEKFIKTIDKEDTDVYLINLSDGEPAWQKGSIDYSGSSSIKHSNMAWKKILNSGVIGLSYFITESKVDENNRNYRNFKEIYGKEAKYIEPGNLVQLASTINEMLMSGQSINSVLSE